MSITDEAGTPRPLSSYGQIISVDVLKLVKDFRLKEVVIHGVDEDSSLSIEGVGTLIHINYEHQFFEYTHTGDMLGA